LSAVLRNRLIACFIVLALPAGLAAGCGSDEDETATTPSPKPAPRAEDFPQTRGKATLGELIQGLRQGPVLAPSVSVLDPGRRNRFGFALFDQARKQINGAEVAIYTGSASQTNLRGPFPARSESMEVRGPYQSQTSSQDPDAAKSVYVSEVPFDRKGRYVMIALARLDGRLVASSAIALRVGPKGGPPRVGDKAIKVDTPTKDDVANISDIDTRIPPGTMHDRSLADVLGKKPVVITFATPALCKSRVCGPIVDELEQLKADYKDRAEFIHMEIYNDNELEKGFRPQVRAWRLPSEPWTFVIDRQGTVVAEFEGAAGVSELQGAIEKAVST
jgi:hypothetical protein